MGRSCPLRASVCLAVLLLIVSFALPAGLASSPDDDGAGTDRKIEPGCRADVGGNGVGVCRSEFWVNSSGVERGSPQLLVHDDSLFFAGVGIANNATLTWIDADEVVVYKVDCRNLAGVDFLDFSHFSARPPTENERPDAYPSGLPVRCTLLEDRGDFAPGRQTLMINAQGNPDRLDGVHGSMLFET